MARLVNASWFCFKLALAGALVAAIVAAPHLWRRVDEEVRRRIEAKLAELYPDLEVHVRSAHLVEGQGVAIRQVTLSERGAPGPQPELLHVEEILVDCTTNLQDLIAGRIEVRRVRVRRPTLYATRRPDGSWSVARLRPAKCTDLKKPPGTIEGLAIEVFDPTSSVSRSMTLADGQLAWQTGVGDPTADPSVAPGCLDCEARFATEFLAGVKLSGQIDLAAQTVRLAGSVHELALSPELLASLPGLPESTSELRGLRGAVSGSFAVNYDPRQSVPLDFSFDLALADGRFDDPRLPRPLEELSCRVVGDPAGLRVEKLSARGGQTTLALDAQRHGWLADSPLTVDAHLAQFLIDRSLADFLPPALVPQWDKFSPSGTIDADLHALFDGQSWHPRLDINCLDVAFSYYRFPYRLERGTGSLGWHGRQLRLHLTAYAGEFPVEIEGQIVDPGPRFTGAVDVRARQLPLDERLLAAFGPKAGPVLRSLHPRGTLAVTGRVWRDDPRAELVHQSADVHLEGGAIRYERFDYPVGQIVGRLALRDGKWTVQELTGSGNGGRITASGNLATSPAGAQLALVLSAADLPLDDDLRAALPANLQRVWDTLRPQGTIDLPSVELNYAGAGKPVSVRLSAQARGENTSIEPTCFPYRMEKLRGALHYGDGRADFDRLDAVHGGTKLTTGGSCQLEPDGGWRLELKNLAVDRLRPERDRELVAALPAALRRVLLQLRPVGQVNLRGGLDFVKSADAAAPVRSRWDVALDLHQVQVDCGVRLDNAFGTVRLAGSSDGRRFATGGELAIQSLMYRNWQIVELNGPLWADDGRVLLGAGATPPEPGRAARRLTARFCDGVLVGDCQVGLGPVAQYAVQATLTEADLARLAQENLAGRQQLAGKVLAQVAFSGTSQGLYTLTGNGGVRLHDADIYELPVMVALLKILSIKPPDITAFDKSDIDFRIQGDRLFFDRINFNGDAISLVGQGQMGLDSSLKLTFHTIVGRDDFRIPLLSNVMGKASQQMMQIHVDGTFDRPVTRSEILPGVNQALQQLQEELQMGAEPAGAARR